MCGCFSALDMDLGMTVADNLKDFGTLHGGRRKNLLVQVRVISLQRFWGELLTNHNVVVQLQGSQLIQSEPIHQSISMKLAELLFLARVAENIVIDILSRTGRHRRPEFQPGMVLEVIHSKPNLHVHKENIGHILRSGRVDFVAILNKEVWPKSRPAST